MAGFLFTGITTGKGKRIREQDAILYIQITRGVAKRNHGFPDPKVSPTVYACLSEFQPSSDQKQAGIKAITLPDERWSRCDIKAIGLLANILAKQTAIEKGHTKPYL